MDLDWWKSLFSPDSDIFWLVITLVVIWSFVWKGIALWGAGRSDHLGWFIILFLVQTLGILDIIYIFLFRRVVPRPQKAPPQFKIIERGDSKIQQERIKREFKGARQEPKIETEQTREK